MGTIYFVGLERSPSHFLISIPLWGVFMDSALQNQNNSKANNQVWRMAAIVLIITVVIAGLLFSATQRYVLKHTEVAWFNWTGLNSF